MRVQPTTKRWEELTATALIGSDRAGKVQPGALLAEAGVIGAMRRAGFAPAVGAPRFSESAEETARACSAGAGALLARLVKQGEWRLVEEWGSLASSAGCVAPAGVLPELFDACATRPSLRAAVRGCMGARGEWLSQQREEWKELHTPAALQDFSAEWATATGPQRRDWLAEVRRHDPTLGRELLKISWNTDSAEERRRLLDLLGVGLSLADEEFLESALADRSKLVREAAARLLSMLPESRYVGRMTARAEGLIKAAGGKGVLRKKVRVAVFAPEAWSAEWEKDGLEEKPPPGMGKRAFWLRQILGAVPPSHWSRMLGLEPDEIIAGLEESDYREDVIGAWMTAAPRFGEMEWCAALAIYTTASKKEKRQVESVSTLWEGLAPDQRESVVAEIVGRGEGRWHEHWEYAASADHAWTEAFSRRVVAALKNQFPSKSPDWYLVGPSIDRIVHSIHPAASAEFEQIVESVFRNDIPPSVGSSLDRLRLRAEMHKEFAT